MRTIGNITYIQGMPELQEAASFRRQSLHILRLDQCATDTGADNPNKRPSAANAVNT